MKRRAKVPPLLAELRAEFKGAADPTKAIGMQAYMKSTLPFLGVTVPKNRAITKKVFAHYPFKDAKSWRTDVLALWHGAEFREEKYAAIALCRHRKAAPFQTLGALPMYEELITSGAWWDLVDELAEHCVGELLRKYPKEMKPEMRRWSRSPDLWKRRTSIISQMFFKKDTDLKLLYDCIAPSLDSKEFFLRKAIGWALRQYAWTDPEEIVRYVDAHEAELSGLSKREALKNVRK
jgi:3-methyladenine DNA glycosylase AlkD